MSRKTKKVEISQKTVISLTFFLISIWFLFQIRDILLALFISLILVGATNPLVTRLEKKGTPRWLAIFSIYLLLLFTLILAGVGLVPPLVDQTGLLIQAILGLSDSLSFLGLSSEVVQAQLQSLGGLPSQIAKLAVSIFSNVATILGISVVTFYLLLEHKNLDQYLFSIFDFKKQKKAKAIIDTLEKKMGGWVRAQILLMTTIGFLSYLGFKLLRLKFALPLAILAGFLELIPNIGPTIAAIPAVIIGMMHSPLIGFLTLAWSLLIQQLENSLIVPKLMQKSVGVNPLVTILSLAIGFKLAGIKGAVLAIPVYLTVETLWFDRPFFKKTKLKKTKSR